MWWEKLCKGGWTVSVDLGRATQVEWSWRGDEQQHVRVGRFLSEPMLRRLPGLGEDVLRSAGFPRAKGEGIYLKV